MAEWQSGCAAARCASACVLIRQRQGPAGQGQSARNAWIHESVQEGMTNARVGCGACGFRLQQLGCKAGQPEHERAASQAHTQPSRPRAQTAGTLHRGLTSSMTNEHSTDARAACSTWSDCLVASTAQRFPLPVQSNPHRSSGGHHLGTRCRGHGAGTWQHGQRVSRGASLLPLAASHAPWAAAGHCRHISMGLVPPSRARKDLDRLIHVSSTHTCDRPTFPAHVMGTPAACINCNTPLEPDASASGVGLFCLVFAVQWGAIVARALP